MRILVVSDLHAMSKDIEALKGYAGGSGALLRVENREDISNPLLSIRQALKEQPPIDLLLCLGDLSHQGKRSPLMIAWQDLHLVASALAIPKVVGIVGNHDIMSRANTADDVEDRAEFLNLLHPRYPSLDVNFNREYFADGVASTVFGKCLFIALNTCRTHGFGLDKEVTQDLFEKGVLTDSMIDKVTNLIAASDLDHVVVAMHHHPLHGPHGSRGEEPIPKGNVLIDQLELLGRNVLVVHGHQHRVTLYKPKPIPKSPYILSCSSLSALPYPGQHTDFSNQFHLIEFDMAETTQPTGRILSWDWATTRWQRSTRQHMPFEVNFGPAVDVGSFATALRGLPRKPFYSSKDLFAAVPHLRFLRIVEVDELNHSLASDGLRVVVEYGKVTHLIFEEDEA